LTADGLGAGGSVAAVRVEQVDFISILTRDVRSALAWYRDVLGLPLSDVSDGEVETPNVTLLRSR
jgi:catechol 2,3-dioxygenase-like lactoylglutathione lyase family enzyme